MAVENVVEEALRARAVRCTGHPRQTPAHVRFSLSDRNQKVSHGKPGEVVKLKPKGAETL